MENYSFNHNFDDYNVTSNGVSEGLFAALGAFFIVILVISLAVTVFEIIAMWKVFVKAGKPGWAALIPFYNVWTLFEIGGQPGAYIFFMFIPCAGPIIYLVFEIKALLEIAKRFGKDTTFGVLSIFFSFVTFPILAFSNAKYNIKAEEKKTSILDVDLDGVPESDERNFDYGFEKEDTVVMKPVEKRTTKKSTAKKNTTKKK